MRGISESRHQRIWNQHKILRFLIPILIFSKKKNFWVIIALFAYFKCKCEKNCTFSNIFKKVKSYFFGTIYQYPFDSYWNSKKSIKLKPPSIHPLETRTDKKKSKFSSYIMKFRMEQLQSYIWLTASSYMRKYLRISSYITAPLRIALYTRKIWFSFLSVWQLLQVLL